MPVSLFQKLASLTPEERVGYFQALGKLGVKVFPENREQRERNQRKMIKALSWTTPAYEEEK